MSLTRAGRSAVYIALAKGECVCVFRRNLSKHDRCVNAGLGRKTAPPRRARLRLCGCESTESQSTHPRSSRKRQITFATISSFLSSPFELFALILVRCASFSDAVAPRQREKSIVDDCACETAESAAAAATGAPPQPPDREFGSAARKYLAKHAHVLPPQLLLDDRVRHIPARNALR